jgi:hypothetical protein
MIRRTLIFLVILGFSTNRCFSQYFVKTSDLFKRSDVSPLTGEFKIVQNPSIDTLISRYILYHKNLAAVNGHYGIEGYRIQVFASASRNAREESYKLRADFINRFPDLVSYQLFAEPGNWMVRVGDFRTRTDAKKLFVTISKVFPDAYIVPDFINFPDLNTK